MPHDETVVVVLDIHHDARSMGSWSQDGGLDGRLAPIRVGSPRMAPTVRRATCRTIANHCCASSVASLLNLAVYAGNVHRVFGLVSGLGRVHCDCSVGSLFRHIHHIVHFERRRQKSKCYSNEDLLTRQILPIKKSFGGQSERNRVAGASIRLARLRLLMH